MIPDIAKLKLEPGDIILITGDVDDDFLESVANETGHFVVVIPEGTTLEALRREEFVEMLDHLDQHEKAR